MGHIINSLSAMDTIKDKLDEIKNKNLQAYDAMTSAVESAYNRGTLDKEDYDELMRTYFRNNLEPNFEKAIQQDIPKMTAYIDDLKQKIQEYLNVS